MIRVLTALVGTLCILALANLPPPLLHAQIGGFPTMAAPAAAAGCAALSLSTTPSNGWSMGRKLNSSYAGSAFQLDLVGATTQDIGFVSGCIDTAAVTSFCLTTCHVKKIYDQYGSVDFTFASYAAAPLYTASCINSRPCMDNTGAPGTATSATNNDLIFTGNFAEAAVIKDNSGSPEGGYFGNVLTSGAFPGQYFGPSTQVAQFKLSFYANGNWGSTTCGNITVVDNAIHMAAVAVSSGTATCQVDGTTGTRSGNTVSNTGTVATLFGGIGGGTYTGLFSEGIDFATTTGDLSGYRTSCQAFWNCP